VNAALVTVSATMLFAASSAHYRGVAPEWSVIGLSLVPVYCMMNVPVYLSQVTVVPLLPSRESFSGS